MNASMSAYSWPGIGLTEGNIINLIMLSFGLENREWITQKSRKIGYVIPRQVLMTCLVDYLGYSVTDAAAVCGKDHATGTHARMVIHQTLIFDRDYKDRVNRVLDECSRIYNALKEERKTND